MPYLRKTHTPGAAPGGHTWDDEASVVEVPAELATELLRMPGEFSEVLPGDKDYPGEKPTRGQRAAQQKTPITE